MYIHIHNSTIRSAYVDQELSVHPAPHTNKNMVRMFMSDTTMTATLRATRLRGTHEHAIQVAPWTPALQLHTLLEAIRRSVRLCRKQGEGEHKHDMRSQVSLHLSGGCGCGCEAREQ